MTGIYVHVPFCRRRCLYCDFYSVGEKLVDWPRFVDALLAEARQRSVSLAGQQCIESELSFYIGGGTPSLIPADEFARLADGLRSIYGSPSEFTIEVNPDDVTPEKVEAWRRAGVNRVSMGVQSMIDAELNAVGRRHSAEDVKRAFGLLRPEFSNISLDLIFGLPLQTLGTLDYSLREITLLDPEHVSVYSLMYEERSALTRLLKSGKIKELPEEDSVRMFELINHRLREAGFERYELSNYAKKNFRSRHNSLYWSGEPYIGLGPGAHSYDGVATRTENVADVRKYISTLLSAPGDERSADILNSIQTIEELSEDEQAEEMIMTRLRTIEGISIETFGRRFSAHRAESLLRKARSWIRSGHLIQTEENNLALTLEGVMISDEIISSLF